MRRAAIYFFYDGQGIVDRYNLFMLEDLRKSCEKIYVVVNGELNEEGHKSFLTVADDVYIRKNEGLDVWAYKDSMEHIGWDVVTSYDEFILMNFTNFGPVFPLQEMFEKMSQKDVDFWGITKHYGHDFDPYNGCEYGYIPPHIQSSFIAIRSSMLCSEDFRRYWDNMPMIRGYEDSICKHEAIFTKKFEDLGYRSGIYVDTEHMKEYIDYPLMLCPVKMMKEFRCPIFKRKTFFNIYEEFMDVTCGEPGWELYQYLKKETSYDVDMIWENLLRTGNMWDIKQRMQLNYVLPTDVEKGMTRQPKVALFFHLYYMEMLEQMEHYAASMPDYADIYISTDTQEKKQQIEGALKDFGGRKVTVVVVKNQGREYAGVYVGLKPYYKQYDYICIAHSKRSRYEKPYIIGDEFSYHCFEHTLATKEYVHNVLATFEENPRLGLLVPPVPEHGMYYTTIGREWRGDHPLTVQLMEMLGVHAPIDPAKPPVAPLGGFFWFRAAALQKLFDHDFEYEDFPEEPCTAVDGTIMHAIERVYPFVAQDAGFYSGWVIPDKLAAMRITNDYKTIRDFNEPIFWVYGECDRHQALDKLNVSLASLQSGNADALSGKQLLRALLKKIAGPKLCSLYRKIVNKIKGDR